MVNCRKLRGVTVLGDRTGLCREAATRHNWARFPLVCLAATRIVLPWLVLPAHRAVIWRKRARRLRVSAAAAGWGPGQGLSFCIARDRFGEDEGSR